MKKILVLGATSGIAAAVARRFAAAGDSLFLVGRDIAKLETLQADLRVRGAALVQCEQADLNCSEAHPAIIDRACTAMGGLDVALLAWGALGAEQQAQHSFPAAREILELNFLGQISALTALAELFEKRRAGSIIALSSVAGDRGRKSNYVYGSAKAGLSAYLQGLRNRLHSCGVHVLTVKPGFVDTPMTAHLAKNVLFASADRVADDIYRAYQSGAAVLYTPWFWRFIMAIIVSIPEALFKRMSL